MRASWGEQGGVYATAGSRHEEIEEERERSAKVCSIYDMI